jgi:thioredoxin 1
MSEIELKDKNFDEEVIKSKLPVLVDFWAPWCGPCQSMLPVVKDIAQEYAQKFKVGKLNIDENKSISQRYNIMSVPTFMIFRGGQILEQFVGMQSKDSLKEHLDQILAQE